MALRDRQILTHLDQLPTEIAKYIMDEVRAYRARLAQGARRVLKGHILKGGIIDFWLNEYVEELPIRVFEQRRDTWKSLRLNWTPRESRYWERAEQKRGLMPIITLMARQWGAGYEGV